MIIISVTVYLLFIFSVIGYIGFIRWKGLRQTKWDLEPDTFVFLGIITLILGLITIFKGKLCIIRQFEIVSLGIALFSIGIALFAWGKSEESHRVSTESRDRMKIIGEGDIQSSIITLLEIRRRLFDDYNKYFIEYKRILNGEESYEEINDRLRNATEWATWEQYRGLTKAMKYKKYLTNKDKKDILLSHKILIDNVMKEAHIGKFLMKKHVNQLLMGCELLKQELVNLKVLKKDFEKEYIELFKRFLKPKAKREDFLKWIRRNMVPDKDEDKLFQILTN